MLPYHYNAGQPPNQVPSGQQQMSQYQQQVNQQYPGAGNNAADMQNRLAHAQQAIQRLNETKQKQQFHQHQQQQHQHQQSYTEDQKRRRDSRSPEWAREARSSSRDRDRNRRRSRSRSRSRDRYKQRNNRRDHRSRSRSPTSRHRGGGGGGRGWRRSRSISPDRNPDRTEWGIPSHKLVMLNIPNDVDNAKISFAFSKVGYLPQDVRTNTKIDNRTNLVKTFAFVEFCDVQTATNFLQENRGVLTLEDGRRVMAEFARPDNMDRFNRDRDGNGAAGGNGGNYDNGGGARGLHESDDWICAHCSMNNFVKRKSCFKCDISKEQSMELEKQGVHMVGVSPCDTLLIRGLPDGCTNTTIFDSLVTLVCLNSISMIKLSESKRFAYLQMKSCDEAVMLLNLTYKAPLKIKNKDVQVSYCRDSMSRLIQQQMQMLTQSAGPEQQNGPLAGNLTGAEIAAAAMAKARAVRNASNNVQQIMSATNTNSTGGGPPPILAQPNFSIPPPNMGGPPIMINNQQGGGPQQQTPHKNGIIGITPTPRGVFPRYLPPNSMHFVVDNNSGYYLDPVTNFYYDQTTGYYFNNETKKWCQWDATYQTYFAVEETQRVAEPEQHQSTIQAIPQPIVAAASQDLDDIDEQKELNISEIEMPKGPKSAAEMAKDMAKWAKKQEKDKKKVQISLKTMAPSKPIIEKGNVFQSEKKKLSAPSSSSAINFEDDEEDDTTLAANIDPHTGKIRGFSVQNEREETSSAKSGATRGNRGTTAMEMREIMERALIDEAKKMCLLCKRAFPSVDVLRKHVDKSELHRTNLEQKRIEWGKELSESIDEEEMQEKSAEIEMPKIVYRDRAKERRKQFGYSFEVGGASSAGTSGRSEDSIRRESEHFASKPLDDNNIGNRLLKNMGWKEGEGMGKNGQGITAPIQAERFVQGAGLGSSGSKIRGGVESSHKEKTRQALFSRYNDQ
ncbi:unnamed protein product [Caenorhabditis angaria]|uniref:Uncharacterized protein n=1 Tax=Caenorhabditis angaria TaxID=860376 RepID=A0A9P1I6N2_9PELO|nr:unnamed protein product [Caenorhabditis angaria]